MQSAHSDRLNSSSVVESDLAGLLHSGQAQSGYGLKTIDLR